ncbi:Mor transcription activator family protein [Marinibacterium anthonyi]|nr:Mor transcription activator family protein [Marinibacterium anthonyi]
MKVYSVSNVARTVISACGQELAFKLVQEYGGQRIDIPKRVAGKLVETLGEELTRVLVEAYAGCNIDVPSRGHVERMHKTMCLWRDVIETDLSSNELAAKHGVTSMWVRKLRSRLRGETPPAAKSKKV